jgi:hypothetical protein
LLSKGLDSWLADNGGSMNKLRVAHFYVSGDIANASTVAKLELTPESSVRGIAASKHFRKHDRVVLVPPKCVLSMETLNADDIFNKLWEDDEDELHALKFRLFGLVSSKYILYILWHIHNGKWILYFRWAYPFPIYQPLTSF